MKTINLTQGSPEWHSHRANHFNASDAPVMLGISPYKTREQLLDEYATGITPEADRFTQKLFADGHRFERSALSLAEQLVGDDLFPVVGVLDGTKLSTSFDGITLTEDAIYEHKSLNEAITKAVANNELLEIHRAQMEQQLLVSGAEKCLFLATKYDANDQLIDSVNAWYYPDNAMRQRIINGWEQFQIDLASWVPKESKNAPIAEAVPISLPTLFVRAIGEITESNLEFFAEQAAKGLQEARSIIWQTDQDFSNAKSWAKVFRENEKQVKSVKSAMLASSKTVNDAAAILDRLAEEFRVTALKLEKDVDAQDKIKKDNMTLSAKNELSGYIATLSAKIKPIALIFDAPNFALSIKGKRNYDSMESAIDTDLRNAKFQVSAIATDIEEKLTWSREVAADYRFLFNDMQQVIYKPIDDFKLLVNSRISKHKSDEEKRLAEQREKIRIEEEAKAKREAEAKVRAEQAEKDRLDREEKQRIAEDEQARSKAIQDERIKAESLAYYDRRASQFEAVINHNPYGDDYENAMLHADECLYLHNETEDQSLKTRFQISYKKLLNIADEIKRTEKQRQVEAAKDFIVSKDNHHPLVPTEHEYTIADGQWLIARIMDFTNTDIDPRVLVTFTAQLIKDGLI